MPSTLEHDWPQHDRFTACFIAQQYSSVALVSLRFHYHKETFGWRVRIFINH
jgi:hypothetical protein